MTRSRKRFGKKATRTIRTQSPASSKAAIAKAGAVTIEEEERWISQLRALGQIQSPLSECAAVLNLSEEQLELFFKERPDARTAYERGTQVGRATLRRRMHAVAMGETRENSTPALKMLAQQYLHLGNPDYADPEYSLMKRFAEEINQIERERDEKEYQDSLRQAEMHNNAIKKLN